jgi:UDP-glucuronate 4-epimerase
MNTVETAIKKKVLVTGSLGFIGYHLTQHLLLEGYSVIGIDNINGYYNVKQKYDKLPFLGIEEISPWPNQLHQSLAHSNFKFGKIDITDRFQIEELFRKEKFDIVVNLAAQAGVQYSIQNPHSYVENNITGFINLIDAATTNKVKHFIYASSSSVYGNRDDVPFNETENVDNPISLYAASKKANELMAHTYSHLHHLKTTGLRFFTVYGPWGRPDMAPFIFTKNILEGKKITVFNKGDLQRDFTYVDDIVKGVFSVIDKSPKNEYVYNIYNIGNSKPIHLMDFIQTIESKLDKKANIKYEPLRKGDVFKTYASTSKLNDDFGYTPLTDISKGIELFISWYINYFKKIR